MVQHVENVKNFERRDETYNMHRMQEMNVLGKIIYRIFAVTCQKSEQEVAVYARKKFIKHQVHYHMLKMKKVIFSRKIITNNKT